MKVAFGTDHGGFALRSAILDAVRDAGREIVDCGAFAIDEADDYPDFAARVARAVLDGRAVQLRAELLDDERTLTVRVGDRVTIEEVDPDRERVRVSLR